MKRVPDEESASWEKQKQNMKKCNTENVQNETSAT